MTENRSTLVARRLGEALVVVATLVSTPARADWLVTRDGVLVETDGAWRVEGDLVYFIARRSNPATVLGAKPGQVAVQTTSGGTLYALPLADVDLARSEAETAARRPAVAVEDPGPGPADRLAGRRLPLPPEVAADPELQLDAREDWRESRYSSKRLELRLDVGGTSYDNFHQAPDGEPQEEVLAAVAEARLTWKPRPRQPFKGYVEAARLEYDVLPSSSAYGAGLRLEGARHGFDLSSHLARGRSAPGIGDVVETADILRHRGRYSLRSDRWEWWLGAERLDQRFDAVPQRRSELGAIGTGLVLRTFGRAFAPEIGAWRLERDSTTDSADYRGDEIYGRLRFSPLRTFAFEVLYQQERRDYVTPDPDAGNFERRDRRDRWTLRTEVLLHSVLAWNLQYYWLEGDSTREGRAFTSEGFATGLTVKLGASGGRRQWEASGAIAAPPLHLVGLDTRHGDGETATTIVGAGHLRHEIQELEQPPRLVLDLHGARIATPLAVPVDTALVRAIRVAQLETDPEAIVRLEFDLKARARPEIRAEAGSLVVRLRPLEG